MTAKSKQNNRILLTAAFAVPLVLLLIIFAAKGIAPFGNNTLAFCDAKGQYISFFKYYRDMLIGKQDAFYTFEKNLGGSVTGLFAYYLASPLNLIFLLFPEENILVAFDILILLKLSLCGLAFAVFLKNCNGLSPKSVMFSTAYALCGYNTAYCWSVMWLDGVILLPLVALGIKKIAEDRRPYLYIVSLAAAVITSFYIGYALCIFSVLYYAYLMYINPSKTFSKFVVSSLAAGGLSACLLVPTVASFSGGKRESGFAIIERKLDALHGYALGYLKSDILIAIFCIAAVAFVVLLFAMIIKRRYVLPACILLLAVFAMFYLKIEYFLQGDRNIFIKTLFGAVNYGEITEGSPNIYSGGLIIMLAVSYFLCREVPVREKVASGVFLAILVLSFVLFIPNIIWHGFTKNTWFNYRYSFIFSFFIIAIAEKAIDKDFSLISLAVLVIPLFAILKMPQFIEKWQIAYETAILICFGVLMFYSKKNIACGIQMAALFLTAFLTMSAQASEAARIDEFTNKYTEHIGIIRELQKRDDGLYRIRKFSPWISYNDPMTFGYNGISHFSSTEKTAVIEYLSEQGYFTYENIYASADDEIDYESDAYLGVKYYIEKDGTIRTNNDAATLAFIELPSGERRNCDVSSVTDSEITVRTNESGKLVFTIPYENGWTAFLDGIRTEIRNDPDIFFSLDVSDGSHEVRLKYTPPGIWTGVTISAATLTALAVSLVIFKKKEQKN